MSPTGYTPQRGNRAPRPKGPKWHLAPWDHTQGKTGPQEGLRGVPGTLGSRGAKSVDPWVGVVDQSTGRVYLPPLAPLPLDTKKHVKTCIKHAS